MPRRKNENLQDWLQIKMKSKQNRQKDGLGHILTCAQISLLSSTMEEESAKYKCTFVH